MGILERFKFRNESDQTDLPPDWNGDWFHFANFRVGGLSDNKIQNGVGYIWATAEWVEYYVFKTVNITNVFKRAGKMSGIPLCSHLIGGCFTVPEMTCSVGFVFDEPIVFGVCSRDQVKYSTNLNQSEFHTKWRGFVDTLYVTHVDEAYQNWKSFHADGNYCTVFSGGTEVGGFYFDDGNGVSMVCMELDSTYQPTGAGSIKHVAGYEIVTQY